MAVPPRLNLTRDQFASFLQDFEQIKQFERLFSTVDTLSTTTVDDVSIAAENAAASANDALAQIARIADALELLAQAPVIENNNSIVTDYIDFDGTPPHVDRIRRMAWNPLDQTLDLGMEYGVIQQIGQETYARVENMTGVTIPNGTVVGFSGVGANNTLSVAPYLADGATPTLYILGVLTHDLPDSGEVGYCTVWGHLRDLDTSAFSLGDILYASPTVAGDFTNVKPTAPDNVIPLAAVLKVGTTDGVIFVRPTIEQERYYGEFYNTTGVTPAAANTAYALSWDGANISDGVTITGSQIEVSESGLYQFNARVQFSSSNANTKSAWLWWKLNGTTTYANSAVIGTLSDNGGYVVLRNSEFFSLAAGDYIELMWAVDDVNLAPTNVASTAFAPAAPCGIVEVTQIQQ
jgi:hypothetical protein